LLDSTLKEKGFVIQLKSYGYPRSSKSGYFE
jgi:hypothetical protein